MTANNRSYDAAEKPLITVTGEAVGGSMQYAIGANAATAPATGWGTAIPTAANPGIYYVWYYAKGDLCFSLMVREKNIPVFHQEFFRII